MSQRIVYATELDADHVFVAYDYELKSGGRYRNTEIITVRGGRVTEVQVFFGGRL